MLDLVRAAEHHFARHHALPAELGVPDTAFFPWEPCARLVRGAASPGRVLAHEICHAIAPLRVRPLDERRDAPLVSAAGRLWARDGLLGEPASVLEQGLKHGVLLETPDGPHATMLPATLALNDGLTELLTSAFADAAAVGSPSLLWDEQGFERWGRTEVRDGAYRQAVGFVANVLGTEDPWAFAQQTGGLERFRERALAVLPPADRVGFEQWLYATEPAKLGCHAWSIDAPVRGASTRPATACAA